MVVWRQVAPLATLAIVALNAACSQPAATAPTPVVTTPAPAQKPEPVSEFMAFGRGDWKTDFSKRTVALSEIRSGGPPRDGIPPIDKPSFVSITEADSWLKPVEPVVVVELGGEARAYPIQILIWHEIVNDTVGGIPVAVTFCPLCNTAIAFDRRLDGRLLDFGTTGNLRKSDLVMWDRQTESWWQQVTGEAIVGELTGARLTPVPASIVSWGQVKRGAATTRVLSRATGYTRDYGRNPYVGYDRIDQSPFLFDGALDGRLPPMERVLTVELGGESAAYPFGRLAERRVVMDTVGGRPIVIFYRPGTSSALDSSSIAASRDVGAAVAFAPTVDGRALTFAARGDDIVDAETGSTWDLLGSAVAGPLAGRRLEPIVSGNHFWFAWAAFRPETRVWAR